MTIDIDISHRQGAFTLEVTFSSDGRLTALFGPSGSGKTTLVNLIGGLLRPSQGRIVVDGRVLVDTDKRIFLPPHRRRIGYVFQDARLFPHMTVSQNLRYGRFFAPKDKRYADFDAVVELLGIGHLLDRRPGRLSGGEKQRVAIGRALVASPRLILMDEPLAALDDARKSEIMPFVERLRDDIGIPIVYVSHSMAEVARLATDVVALSGGRVSAAGNAQKVLSSLALSSSEERDEAGALIELEMLRPDDGYGLTLLHSRAGECRLPMVYAPAGSRLRARVRARDVMVATTRPEGISALNVLAARVTSVEAGDGSQALVRLAHGEDEILARLTRRSVASLGLEPGLEVFAVVKAVSFEGNLAAAPRV